MRVLAGQLFTPQGWVEGHVVVEAGRCVEVRPGPARVEPAARGVVVPAFVNAHTHVGDAVARGTAIPDDLAAAVGPAGHKHRVLAAAPETALVEGMARALGEAREAGCAWVVDFREQGLEGLARLGRAQASVGLGVRAYGRPAQGLEDAAAVLAAADGLAVSSVVDDPGAPALAAMARAAGKGFALHASEGAREPVDPVLDLAPELVVHLTFAERGDLARVADAGARVAVCPRSNARWAKRLPDVRAMLDLGLGPALGTDNAMLGSCDPRAEAGLLLQLARDVAPDEALAMLTHHGWAVATPGEPGPLAPGGPAELLVFQRGTGPPVADVLGPGARLLHRERGPAGV